MARHFYKEDVTAFSWNSLTGLLDELGRGTLTKEVETVENRALNDVWKSPAVTVAGYTFDGEIACSAASGAWLKQAGSSGTLAFTSTNDYVSGTFLCTRSECVNEDAMRYNVQLISQGEVDESAGT